jgi:RNA polymerase sigma factor (TIGR02999 family)
MNEEEAIEQLLSNLAAGDAKAESHLYKLAYDRLRRLARKHVRKSPGNVTINPTSLVHEAWLKYKYVGSKASSSSHFYNVLSQAMRQIILDAARRRGSSKFGGDQVRTELSDDLEERGEHSLEELVAIDAALKQLNDYDPALAQLVEWHYFAGLSFTEIARERDVATRTVRRHWKVAHLLLGELMDQGPSSKASGGVLPEGTATPDK